MVSASCLLVSGAFGACSGFDSLVISSAFRLLAFSAFDGVDEEEVEDEDELDVADDIVDDEEDIDDVLSSFWFNISDIVGFNASFQI